MQCGSRGEGERKSYRPQSGVSARLAELCRAEELSRVLGTEQRLWGHPDTRVYSGLPRGARGSGTWNIIQKASECELSS